MSYSPRSLPLRNFALESLEVRRLFHNVLVTPLPDQNFNFGDSAVTVDLSTYIDNTDINGTVVEMDTTSGKIDVELYDNDTPITVANFLNYVNSGRYNNTIFHRLIPNFILQGGGYDTAGTHITTDAPIQNEYSPTRSNLVGTIAMAKVGPADGADPTDETINSATSEWFFNLADNSSNLDNQNGGFTVFGKVLDMTTVNKIAALTTTNAGSSFPNLPVDNGFLVVLNTVSVVGENTFTISSSNPSVIAPTVAGSQLTLNPVGAGTSTVTVTATTPDGDVLTDSFDVNVVSNNRTVILGTGGGRSLTFTDADGTRVTATARNTAATFVISGAGDVNVTTRNGVNTVTGTNLSIQSLDLTQATSASALTISASGGTDGVVTLPAINVDGTLGSFVATRATLTGDLTATGALGRVSLGSIVGASVVGGTAEIPLILNVGTVTDGSVNVAGSISSLVSGAWTNTDATTDSIHAADIRTMVIRGDFSGDVTTIDGGLVLANITGNVSSDDWHIATTLGRLVTGSWTGTGEITAADITLVSSRGDFSPSVTTTTGGVRSVSIRGDVTGDTWNIAGAITTFVANSWTNSGSDLLKAASIRSLVIRGDFGPDVTTLSDGIVSSTVSGTVTGGAWNITGGTSRFYAADTAAGWMGVYTGAINSFSVRNTFAGALTALSVRSLVSGTMSAPVTVSETAGYAITSLVATTMTNAEVRSAGSIRSIVVRRGATHSGIYAGLDPMAATANTLADFTNPAAQILSAVFSSARGDNAFSDSAIAAPLLGRITLGTVTDTAGTFPFFGVAADSVNLLSVTLDGNRVRILNAADQGAANTQLAAQNAAPTNFVVRIL